MSADILPFRFGLRPAAASVARSEPPKTFISPKRADALEFIRRLGLLGREGHIIDAWVHDGPRGRALVIARRDGLDIARFPITEGHVDSDPVLQFIRGCNL